jgi:capsid protein
MLRKTWRLNQKRGTPEMIAAAADQQDLYELREKIKQTAKVVATMAGVVKKKDTGQELDLRRELQDASAEDTEAATGSSSTEGSGSQQVAYERLGSLTGGALEYLEDDDDFQLLDTDRPSLDFMDVLDRILRQAGASVGLTKTYSTMSTEASYTAFRGDLLLSWTTFEVDQKFLERNWCDRAARMAINKRFGEFDWSASWEWPTMPAVDPLKDAQARVYMLQHLLSSYSKELGPQWRSIFASLAEESKVAKEDHKLPLRIFEGEKEAVRFTNQPKSEGSDTENEKDLEK